MAREGKPKKPQRKAWRYDFARPADVRRFRADMSDALQRVNVNRPHVAPLVPLDALEEWWAAACERHGLSPSAVRLLVEGR